MPINLSDEGLAAFDALGDDDKSSLIDEIDDGDATALADAYTAWKKRGTQPLTLDVPEGRELGPTPMTLDIGEPKALQGQFATGPVEPTVADFEQNPYAPKPVFSPTRSVADPAPARPVRVGMFAMPSKGKVDTKAAGDAVRDNIVRPVQKHIGMPIAGTMLEASEPEGTPALTKRVNRKLLSAIAGPGIDSYGMAPAEEATGAKTSASVFGVMQAPVEGVLEGVGDPSNYIPLGWEKRAAAMAKGAPAFLRWAAEPLANAAENVLIDSAKSVAGLESDPLSAAVTGFGMKTLFKATGKAASVASEGAARIRAHFQSLDPLETHGILRDVRVMPEELRAPPGQPVTSAVAYQPWIDERGNLFGRKAAADGTFEDVPLNSAEAARKYRAEAEASGGAYGEISPDDFRRAANSGDNTKAIAELARPSADQVKKQKAEAEAAEKQAVYERDNQKTNSMKAPQKVMAEAVPPDAAPVKNVVPEQGKLNGGEMRPEEAAIAQPEIAEDSRLMGVIKKLGDSGDKMLKGLVNGRHRGLKELRHHIREAQAVKMFDEERRLLQGKLRALLPDQKAYSTFDLDLDQAIRANSMLRVHSIMSKHGAAWDKMKGEVYKLLLEKQKSDALFKQLTGIDWKDFSPADDDAMTAYVARRYKAFTNPKEWEKYVFGDKPLLSEVMVHVRETVPELRQASDAHVEKYLHDVLEEHRAGGKGGPAGPYGKQSMFARKDIHPTMRKFLGEERSGMINLAESIGTQRAIIKHLQVWGDIASDANAFRHNVVDIPKAELPNWAPVPQDRKKFGAAAGGYVRKEIHEALIEYADEIPRSAEWVRAINSWQKKMQVGLGGARPILRSVFGNIDSSVATGGMSIMRAGKELAEAHRIRRAYLEDPDSAAGSLLREAKVYGADGAGFGAIEMSREMKQSFKEFEDAFAKQSDKSTLGYIKAAAEFTARKGQKGMDFLTAWVDYNDQIFRLANYVGLKRKYRAAGMEPEAAARKAAERINKYFWQAQNIGRYVEKFRGGIGIAAPYLTARAEDMRTKLNMARGFIDDEDPGYKFRMLAWNGLFFGGAIMGSKGVYNMVTGSDDPEAEAAGARITDRAKFYKPGLMPVRIGKDAKGRWQAFDWSTFSFPWSLMQGMPGKDGQIKDHVAIRIAANLVADNFSPVLEEAIKSPLYKMGALTPSPEHFQQKPMSVDEDGYLAVLKAMGQTAMEDSLVPGAITKAVRGYDYMNSASETAPTPGQYIAQQAGIPVQSIPNSSKAVVKEARKKK
jgi:hypothetical protein